MLGFYNYTVVLTYVSALISFGGILLASQGNFGYAVLCLMLSGICDMFDGKVASTKKRTRKEKNFGIQIDSLSDLVCFGVLPAVWVYQLSGKHIAVLLISCLYLLGALIRLAYFNVDEAERQQQTEERRAYYQGLPVTSSAIFLPLVYILGRIPGFPSAIVSAVVLLAMAIAFISPFKMKKPAKTEILIMSVIGVVELIFVIWSLCV